MVQAERLSAVAKRRKLNGSNAGPLAPPTASIESQSVPQSISVSVSSNQNSFAALSSTSTPTPARFEHIANLSPSIVVARLNKDEKCLVSGVYSICVKKGAVSINCAVITPDTGKQVIFAPENYEIPPIICVSTKQTEIELHNVTQGFPRIFNLPLYKWSVSAWFDENLAVIDRSFYIADSRVSLTTTSKQLKELELSPNLPVRLVLKSSAASSSSQPPVILFCGLRSTAASACIAGVINDLLSSSTTTKHNGFPSRVLFCDLDPVTPEFNAPGTFSLVLVERPILGPSFSHPAQKGLGPHELLISTWAGTDISAPAQIGLTETFLSRVISQHQKYRNIPLFIKVCDRFRDYGSEALSRTANNMKPTHVFFIRSITGSSNDRFGRQLATLANATFDHISLSISTEPTLVEQHDSSLQSHFLALSSGSSNELAWTNIPLVLQRPQDIIRHVTYSTAYEQGQIAAFWLNNAVCDPTRLQVSLKHATVAILVETKESSLPPTQLPAATNSCDLSAPNTAVYESLRTKTASGSGIPFCWKDDGIECEHEFLALGIVKEVNMVDHSVSIWTPLAADVLRNCIIEKRQLHMVVITPDGQGRFSSRWALGDRPSWHGKSVSA